MSVRRAHTENFFQYMVKEKTVRPCKDFFCVYEMAANVECCNFACSRNRENGLRKKETDLLMTF